jgi:tetratricopeptide (TPR) repeat protein
MSDNFFKTNRELIIFTVLSLLVMMIYWQTTGFEFINLDDNQYVFDNAPVLSGLNSESFKWAFTAFHSANWHPLTWLSHMLDVKLFGLNSGGHHAVNIVFHLINSLLAFAVFRKMTGCFWKSAIVAALFAVHPAHVESVAWVSERKDVLSTIFWLLTMFAYLRFAETKVPGSEFQVPSSKSQVPSHEENEIDSPENDQGNLDVPKPETWNLEPGTKFYLLTIVLFILGLMSKPMLVTLPFVLLLLDYWPIERLKTLKDLPALLIEKIPFFVLSAGSCYITILAQRSVGAVETLDYLPIDTRLLNSLISYAKYIVTLFYPVNLAVLYPYDRNFPAWQITGAVLLLIGITALCLWQIRTRKYLLMGWLWFLGTLVPVIGIVQVGSQPLADRYTYIPYFGLFIMLVWGICDVFEKFKLNKTLLAAIFGIVIVTLSFLSFRQVSVWRNNEIIYGHALAVTKDNFLISHNLCYTLILANRLDEAEPLCRAAIQIKPDHFQAYNTLGILQVKRGQYAEAEQNFQKVLDNMPNYSLTYANLALALALDKKPEEAEVNLEKAVRLDNGMVKTDVWINALNALAISYSDQEKYEKAAENLTRILAIDSNNVDARGNLALTFYHLKRYDEAQKLIESTLQLDPNQAVPYNTYGLILLEQGRKVEAAGLFQKALQLNPDFAEAKENLKKAKGEK